MKILKDSQSTVKEISPIETIEINDDDETENKSSIEQIQFINQQNIQIQNQLHYTNSNPMMRLQFAASSITPMDPLMYVNQLDTDQKPLFKGL